jgi:hypothetical protein
MILEAADTADIPGVLLLALCKAESNLDPEAERWRSAGETAAARLLITRRDMAGLQRLIDRIVADGSSDISFGLCQQTYRWSYEWQVWQQGWDAEAVYACRHLYFDPAWALEVAASKLKELEVNYPIDWLCRYNKPNGQVTQAVRTNYLNAYNWAANYLAEMEDAMAGFNEGFYDLAQRLGEDVVGEAVTDEFAAGEATMQVTSKGLMVYAQGGAPLFLAATDPL